MEFSKPVKPFDPSIDYNKELRDEEFKIDNGKPFVYLKGLERLAKERGVLNAMTIRLEQLGQSGVLCTYQYAFQDGRLYQGSADATIKNCDGDFKLYLTAMAESRAKARCLRTAFAISTCSVEEKADATVDDDPMLGPIADEQIELIRLLAKKNNLGKEDVFSLMEVPRDARELKNLTRAEALEIIGGLNGMGKKTRSVRRV